MWIWSSGLIAFPPLTGYRFLFHSKWGAISDYPQLKTVVSRSSGAFLTFTASAPVFPCVLWCTVPHKGTGSCTRCCVSLTSLWQGPHGVFPCPAAWGMVCFLGASGNFIWKAFVVSVPWDLMTPVIFYGLPKGIWRAFLYPLWGCLRHILQTFVHWMSVTWF